MVVPPMRRRATLTIAAGLACWCLSRLLTGRGPARGRRGRERQHASCSLLGNGVARGRLVGSAALSLASVLVTLALLEAAFRLAGVSVGTVQINRATVRRSDNPRLRFELRPGSAVRAEVEYRVNAEGLRGAETTRREAGRACGASPCSATRSPSATGSRSGTASRASSRRC